MAKTIKVTADNKISIVNVRFNDYRAIQAAIGGMIEPVKTQRMWDYFHRPMLMLVDEEGHIKGLTLNRTGSWLYGADKHGHPIAGDFILAVPTHEDFAAPPAADLEFIKARLIQDFDLVEMTAYE